jgi:4-hydroxyphenylpyruvate dioxygenase-like putative hemolysin
MNIMEEGPMKLSDLKVDQLGFVFKDIETQAWIMEQAFGLTKFMFGKPETQIIQYRGKESRITSQLAFSQMKGTQIELINWIDGECTYKEFLEGGKEGLHHIATYVEDTDLYLAEFHKQGISVLQAGEVLYTRFTYLDTQEKFGTIIELLERIKRRKKK